MSAPRDDRDWSVTDHRWIVAEEGRTVARGLRTVGDPASIVDVLGRTVAEGARTVDVLTQRADVLS